jgi:hypothetical protein
VKQKRLILRQNIRLRLTFPFAITMTFKQQIHAQCLHTVRGKLEALHKQQQDLSFSLANETKSTAGDKYETARAMLHLGQEQLATQVAALMQQQAVLQSLNPSLAATQVGPGCLVKAGDQFYYFSVALGKLRIDDQTVFVLSLQSPLGNKLKGLHAGDSFELNGKALVIEEVS